MAKKDKEKQQTPAAEETAASAAEETVASASEGAAAPAPEKLDPWEEKYNAEHDAYLRLAAEFDNFRKRTAKEKEQLYVSGRCDAVEKLLPVYDNLERALNQPTEDTAYQKGVEMTLTQLVTILNGLGVEIFGQVGDPFDPAIHNAIVHTEDDTVAESTITQVFQKGFRIGEKIVRFAMVQVAN